MKKILIAVLSTFALIACESSQVTFSFTLDNLGQNVDFHTELQAKYNAAEDYTTTSGIASGSTSKEYPLPVTLFWNGEASDKKVADSFRIDIYEGSSETPSITKTFKDNKDNNIYNLKINTDYRYTVTAIYDSGASYTSEPSSFKTSNKGPRNLFVENVMNIRDLGGHGIKQGLIYRSGRFNEEDGTTKITDATIETMVKELGVKTEIDLRRPNEHGQITSSPLGDKVNYLHLPMYYGGENVLTHVGTHSEIEYDNPAQIKVFFETLADKNNYPIDFHCAIGKDRTGCMAYLIEALCGMEEEYLYRDYLFSNFAKISGICEVKDIDERYGATIKEYNGGSLQEKTYNYLNEVIGVSKDNLDAIKNILIDK